MTTYEKKLETLKMFIEDKIALLGIDVTKLSSEDKIKLLDVRGGNRVSTAHQILESA